VGRENRDFLRGSPRFRVFSAREIDDIPTTICGRRERSIAPSLTSVWYDTNASRRTARKRRWTGSRGMTSVATYRIDTIARERGKKTRRKKVKKTRPKWTIDDGSSLMEGRKYPSKDARYSPSSIEKNGNERKNWITTVWRSLTASGDLDDLCSAHSNHYNRRWSSPSLV